MYGSTIGKKFVWQTTEPRDIPSCAPDDVYAIPLFFVNCSINFTIFNDVIIKIHGQSIQRNTEQSMSTKLSNV